MLFDEAYHVLVDSIQDGIIYGHTAMDKEVKIEVDACRPLVCNEHFVSLSTLTYSTFAIFPYDVNGTNVLLYCSMISKNVIRLPEIIC